MVQGSRTLPTSKEEVLAALEAGFASATATPPVGNGIATAAPAEPLPKARKPQWHYPKSEEEITRILLPAIEPTGLQKAQEVFSNFVGQAAETTAGVAEGVAIPMERVPQIPKGPSKLARAFAEGVRDLAARVAPSTGLPKAEEGFLPEVAGALGSSVPFLAGGAAGQVARIPSWLSIGLLGATSNGAAGYLDAINHGADDGTAWKSYVLNWGAGLPEGIPLSRILSRVNKVTGGGLKKLLVDALIEGSEEFSQEAATQAAGNLIAQHLYDEERKALEGVLESGEAGLGAGLILSILASGAGRVRGGEAPLAGSEAAAVAEPAPEVAPQEDPNRRSIGTPIQALQSPAASMQELAERGQIPTLQGLTPLEELEAPQEAPGAPQPPAAPQEAPAPPQAQAPAQGPPSVLEGPEAAAWIAKVRAQRRGAPPAEGERRGEERLRVEDMTDEEMKVALLTHDLTGLPNKRAFKDFESTPVEASIDGDSVAFFNDNLGHAVGDQVLKAQAAALGRQTGQAYHLSGDEFALRGQSAEELEQIAQTADAELAGVQITGTDTEGRPVLVPRLSITWGIGPNYDDADLAMQREKTRRERLGLRAPRKTPPPGTLFGEVGEPMEAFLARVEEARAQGLDLEDTFPAPPPKPEDAQEEGGLAGLADEIPDSPQETQAPEVPLEQRPLTELRALAKERGLDSRGGKKLLLQKLQAASTEQATQGQEAPAVAAQETAPEPEPIKQPEPAAAQTPPRSQEVPTEKKTEEEERIEQLERDFEANKPKLKKKEIEIRVGDGDLKKVRALSSGKGLAINGSGRNWSVTHEASGLRVIGGNISQGDARFLLHRLLPLTDWTQPAPSKNDLGPLVQKLSRDIYADLGVVELHGGIPPLRSPKLFAQPLPVNIDEDGIPTLHEESAFQVFRRLIQDRFLRVRQTQAALPSASDKANVDRAQRLFPGRTKARLDQLEARHTRPIQKTIAQLPSLEAAEEYLYAVVAPRRNDVIAKRNPERFGDVEESPGSGMATSKANAIVQEAESGPHAEHFKKLRAQVRALNEERLSLLEESGLIDSETAELWRATYPEYAPLRTNAPAAGRGLGSGFQVKGPESKRAKGRRSLADHPILFSLLQAQQSIVRAEKNKVARAMLELVRENPYPQLWEISKGRPKPTVQEDGELRRATDERFTLGERSVAVKEDGQEWIITFADPLMAKAMKNLSAQEMGKLLQFAQRGVRLYSQLQTSLNPEFVVSNFLRDLQTAGIHLSSEHSPKLAGKIAKDVRKAIAGSWRALRDPQAKGEWERAFHEYRMEGGKIDWYYTPTIDEQLAAFQKTLDEIKNPRRKAAVLLRGTVEFIDDLNGAVENGIRLSTFKHLRAAGVSGPDAAAYARGLTVDFNQKGEWGAGLNTAYLFFNAGVQGTTRTVTALATSPRARKIAGGLIAGGFLLELLNTLGGGEDDDGIPYWEKISEEEKDRNMIVMIPGTAGKRIMVPLPWGYNVFHSIGRNAGALMPEELGGTKGHDASKAIGNVVRSGWGAFSPLGSEPTIFQMLSFTLTDPIVQLGENVAFHGGPITKEPFPGTTTPRSELYWNSTGEIPKWVAKKLNQISGGSAARPGKIDLSPDAIEHIFEFATGGTGRFLENASKTGWDLASGERPRLSEVPFLRRVLGEPNEWWDTSTFYDNKAELSILEDELELTGSSAERRAFLERWGKVLALKGSLNAAARLAKAARDRGDEEAARAAYRRFNQAFREARSQAKEKAPSSFPSLAPEAKR